MTEKRRGKLGKTRRSPRLRQLLRGLLRRKASREVEADPQPECISAVSAVRDGAIYCTHEAVKLRIGGAAVRCVGTRCGVSELPKKKDEEE